MRRASRALLGEEPHRIGERTRVGERLDRLTRACAGEGLDSRVDEVEDQSARGIAAVAALQQPVYHEPGDLVLTMGTGYYEGEARSRLPSAI